MNASQPRDYRELCDLSAEIGNNIALVQGGGGNASIKDDAILWIKASGTWLAQAVEEDIFLPLDLRQVRRAITAGESDPASGTELSDSPLRPSIETSLHALLPHRVVFHVHSVNTIARAVMSRAALDLEPLLQDFNWLWVPYARPGMPLTNLVQRGLQGRNFPPDVLVLANHGLVLGADSLSELADKLTAIEDALSREPRQFESNGVMERLAPFTASGRWRVPNDPMVHGIAIDPLALEVAAGGVLYPDHVVFLGAELPLHRMPSGEKGADGIEHMDGSYLVLPDRGVLVSSDISSGAEAMLSCLSLVARRIEPGHETAYLSDQDIGDLLNWEAEAYRRRLNLESDGSPSSSDLA